MSSFACVCVCLCVYVDFVLIGIKVAGILSSCMCVQALCVHVCVLRVLL